MAEEREQLQRSVFAWVGVENEGGNTSESHETITAYDVATKYGCPKDVFTEHINQEIEEAESCQSLPFTLLLVISYAVMVIAHDDAKVVNAVEDSIDFDVHENANFAFSSDYMGHKGMEDVNSHADFWSWMQKGFVPLIFQQSRSFSEESNMTHPAIIAAEETFARRDRGVLLNYNRIVGGIRMSQERSGEDGEACPTSPNSDPLLEFYDKPCVRGLKYELDPEFTDAKMTIEPQRVTWLYINDDIEDVHDQMIDMETSIWLDEKTRKVELALPIYNAEYGLHTLVFVNFFFSRGGHIWKDIIPMSTYSSWYDSWIYAIYDTIWVGCVLYILITELKEVFTLVRSSGAKAIITEYIGFWNVVDWVSVVVAFLIMVLFNLTLSRTTTLNDALEKLGNIDEGSQQAAYRAQMNEHIAALEDQVHGSHLLKLVLASYPMIIVLRLFKAFASQPRLAVVTKTLDCASIDLVHFLLVFSSVFLTYAVAGVVLFGREVDSFTTFGRAVNTCFRCMMGDFDWDAMSVVGRVDAGIWFWTFMIIVVLLMLNMLLAIVMDAYSEVKMKVGNAETLWQEASQAITRMKGHRTGFLVPLSEVLKALQNDRGELKRVKTKSSVNTDMSDPEGQVEYVLVTVDYLRRFVPSLRVEQAIEMIQSAVEGYYEENKEEADMEELLQLIRKVNYRTKKLKKQVSKEGEDDETKEDINFTDELAWCSSELSKARSDLGTWPEDEEGGEDAQAFHSWDKDQQGQRHSTTRGSFRKAVVKPFHNLEEVIEGMMAVILDDVDKVLKACRDAGIGVENDALRRATCGTEVQVLEKDAHDNTVKIRVPGVGDLWYGFQALGPVPDENAHGSSSTLGSETVNAQQESAALERRIQELEGDLRAGRQTVSEALMAVSELEWRLHQTHEARRQVKGKFELLKKKMVVLHKENKRLQESISEMEQKIEAVSGSKNEYFELVRKMVDENQELKLKITDAQKTAASGGERSAGESQNRNLQRTLEIRLDDALAERSRVEESTVRAYQNLAQRVQEIALALEHSKGAPGGRGSPRGDTTPRDIARELLALRDGARAMLRKTGGGRDQSPNGILAIQDGPADDRRRY
eukprot:gnl/MRDRNA2_/MRDRNA2_77764_c0_seq1.p1 gnl/MRDRNA2_/MRDRNA2_77764_c0~~gnl/MRDRNA2_/MRDRNA2_77764_c0_seq1.p1  ORF type:complete len:1096 (+),score=233.83 gnl/MRDRNA2_/MRDRNA2_77764_c0_seq1:65-3352(+)